MFRIFGLTVMTNGEANLLGDRIKIKERQLEKMKTQRNEALADVTSIAHLSGVLLTSYREAVGRDERGKFLKRTAPPISAGEIAELERLIGAKGV